MFDFFTDTYREYVKGIDVDAEKKRKREEEKAGRIIYPKDVKLVTYVLAVIYIISAIFSITLTVKFKGIDFSVISTLFLMVIAVLVMVFLSRKTRKGEIAAIVLTLVFATGLYGTVLLSPLFI
ncbi:MAG: hypothetical protein J6N21_11490 [Butyrivibrio sp.]|nr:hypothetical protein [Butyrivibrio sp.]